MPVTKEDVNAFIPWYKHIYINGLQGSSVVECLPNDKKSLWLKPLPRHPVVEVSSSLTSSPAAHISIMLPRPVKQGVKCTADTTNKHVAIRFLGGGCRNDCDRMVLPPPVGYLLISPLQSTTQ